jgi:hypothetical protein
MTGKWPNGLVDHKNHKKADDRWVNLREATHSQNNANRKKDRKGVSWIAWRKKYRVMVAREFVGYFNELQKARNAYRHRAKEVWGEFAYVE